MAITAYSQWSTTAASNTDLNSISLAEGVTLPSSVNNLFREMMAQLKTGGFIGTGSAVAFSDSLITITDNADATKIAAFQASGITTGTTRTYTLPNATGTLALTTDFIGTTEEWIDAGAFVPQITNGPSASIVELATTLQPLLTLDFDTTTQEFAVVRWVPPKRWDGGTVTFTAHWTAASGSGTAGFLLEGVAVSNDDPLAAAYGTAVAVIDTLTTANDLHISPASTAITIAGTPADADMVWLRIKRDVSTDTLAVDAKLLGIVLSYTTSAGTDA